MTAELPDASRRRAAALVVTGKGTQRTDAERPRYLRHRLLRVVAVLKMRPFLL